MIELTFLIPLLQKHLCLFGGSHYLLGFAKDPLVCYYLLVLLTCPQVIDLNIKPSSLLSLFLTTVLFAVSKITELEVIEQCNNVARCCIENTDNLKLKVFWRKFMDGSREKSKKNLFVSVATYQNMQTMFLVLHLVSSFFSY